MAKLAYDAHRTMEISPVNLELVPKVIALGLAILFASFAWRSASKMTVKELIVRLPIIGQQIRRAYRGTVRLPFIARWTIMDQESLLAFWQTPEPDGNVPADYLTDDAIPRSAALLELISGFPKDSKILEVGCNAGRNVAYLFDAGYTNIEAVEISPHAVRLLREAHPQLADVPIHIGAAETLLKQFHDKSFDLVLTMAVMEHIHPDSERVFDDIARIGKNVLAIEPADGFVTSRQYPRRLPKVFGARGMKLASETTFELLPGYAAYLFRTA